MFCFLSCSCLFLRVNPFFCYSVSLSSRCLMGEKSSVFRLNCRDLKLFIKLNLIKLTFHNKAAVLKEIALLIFFWIFFTVKTRILEPTDVRNYRLKFGILILKFHKNLLSLAKKRVLKLYQNY